MQEHHGFFRCYVCSRYHLFLLPNPVLVGGNIDTFVLFLISTNLVRRNRSKFRPAPCRLLKVSVLEEWHGVDLAFVAVMMVREGHLAVPLYLLSWVKSTGGHG